MHLELGAFLLRTAMSDIVQCFQLKEGNKVFSHKPFILGVKTSGFKRNSAR